MKIAIPVDENTGTTAVCPSFGRAPYFMIYNSETKEQSYIENRGAQSQGGAGIKAAQHLVDEKVDIVLTPRCGENSVEVLRDAHIELLQTNTSDALANIEAWEQRALVTLTKIHAGFHGHGHGGQ